MKSWAIVVGINTYPPLTKQKPLHGAVADACDFADWVLDPAGGNVAPGCLYFWTHPWPAAQQGRLQAYLTGGPSHWFNEDTGSAAPDNTRPPKAWEITRTIEDVGRSARGSALENDDDETRRVYVFLAGHGVRARTMDSDQETCFIAGNFRPINADLVAGLVPCDTFRRALLNDRFDEAILFTDCCRAETARSALRAQQVSDYRGQPTEPYSIAFAAQDDKLAFETSNQPVRGAFSSALMRGLRTHRPGPQGALHAGPLRQYVIEDIKNFTSSGQTPNVRFQPDPDGPLIVSGVPAIATPAPNGPLIDVSTLVAGTQLVLYGGDDKPLPGIGPFIVAGPTIMLPPLSPGLYRIAATGGPGSLFTHPSTEPVHVG